MFRVLSGILCFLLLYSAAGAQPANTCETTTFQKILYNPYSSLSYRSINEIIETADSNLVLTGRMSNSNTFFPDYIDSSFIVKTNRNGEIIWSKKHDTPFGYGIVVELPDLGYIVSGYYGADSIQVTRLSKDGDLVWAKKVFITPVNPQFFNLFDMILTSDNNLLIWGLSDADFSYMLLKLDLNCNVIWTRTYTPAQGELEGGLTLGYFRKSFLLEDADGYVALIPSDGTTNGQSSCGLMKVNKADGNWQWGKKFVFPGHRMFGRQILKTNHGIQLISRFLSDGGASPPTMGFTNLSPSGNLVNSYRLHGLNASRFIRSRDDHTIAVGIVNNPAQAVLTSFLYQLNDTGSFDWGRKYDLPVPSSGSGGTGPSLIQVKDGGLVSIISRRNQDNTSWINAIIKTDQTGSSGGCPSSSFTLPVSYPQLNIADINLASSGFLNLAVVNFSYVLEVEPLNVDAICTDVSICSAISLSGPDTVCNFNDSLVYAVNKNQNCHTVPIWQLADTTFGSITIIDDSTATIKFKKNGSVWLRTILPSACEDFKDSILVTVLASPDSIELGADKELCQGSIILHGGPGFKLYRWQDGSTDSIYIVSSPGIYYLEAENYCGQVFSDTINIAAAPIVSFDLGVDRSKCNNDTLTLTAPAGFASYAWHPIYSMNQTLSPTIRVYPSVDTFYVCTAVRSNGCIVSDTLRINVFHSSPPDLGIDMGICRNTTKLLDAGTGFISYLWSTGEGSQQIQVNQQGVYWVSVTDMNNCISRDSFSLLSIFELPVVNIGPDTTLCRNSSYTFNAGGNFSDYTWQNGAGGTAFNASQTGSYWVTVTDINSCTASDTAKILAVHELPERFLAPVSAEICFGDSMKLAATGSNLSYLWFNNSTSGTVHVKLVGEYWLQAKDTNGCIARETAIVTPKDPCPKAIYFPRAFTPDRNGLNDFFGPTIYGPVRKFYMAVFNRYGEKVFETRNPSGGWDGRHRGQPQDTNVYVWYARYLFEGPGEKEQTTKGSFVLIR